MAVAHKIILYLIYIFLLFQIVMPKKILIKLTIYSEIIFKLSN